jgi:uncharacterized membrane protein HdeD (DUF308 family)
MEGNVNSFASSPLRDPLPKPRSHGWSIFLGILLVIAGILAIAVPIFAGIAASIFFGWLILIGGVAHLIYAWSERTAGHVVWEVLIGLAYIAAALYMLYRPLAGMAALTLVLAVYIGVSGIFELAAFATLRRVGGAGWFLLDGIISLLLAGLIFFHWPASSVWAIGTLVGISLLFSGIARLTLPMRPALRAI